MLETLMLAEVDDEQSLAEVEAQIVQAEWLQDAMEAIEAKIARVGYISAERVG